MITVVYYYTITNIGVIDSFMNIIYCFLEHGEVSNQLSNVLILHTGVRLISRAEQL